MTSSEYEVIERQQAALLSAFRSLNEMDDGSLRSVLDSLAKAIRERKRLLEHGE